MEEVKNLITKICTSVRIHRENWSNALADTELVLKSLSSYCDQLQCVRQAQPCELTRRFSYLKSKLELIILSLIDEEVLKLQSSLDELSNCNQKLKSSSDVLNNTLKVENIVFPFNAEMCEATCFIPSSYEMIEMIDDLHIFSSTRLCKAKHFLEVFDNTPEAVLRLENTLSFSETVKYFDIFLSKTSFFCIDT